MAAAAPTVVWTPNVEIIMLLANLTESGPTFQPRAVNAMRRAALLRFEGDRRSPAVVDTQRLLTQGFWLDALAELALAAEPFPKAGFAYALSHETRATTGTTGTHGSSGTSSTLPRSRSMPTSWTSSGSRARPTAPPSPNSRARSGPRTGWTPWRRGSAPRTGAT